MISKYRLLYKQNKKKQKKIEGHLLKKSKINYIRPNPLLMCHLLMRQAYNKNHISSKP